MIRLYQNTHKIPDIKDSDKNITLLVGLSNIANRSKKALNEMTLTIQSYIKAKKYLLLMPLPFDKYDENVNTIHIIREMLENVDSEYVKLIEDENIQIGDYNFICTPLYTNFNTFGNPAQNKFKIKSMHPDFKNIKFMQKNLEITNITPDNIVSEFNISYKYICEKLDSDKKNIIFTIWSPIEVEEENAILSAYSSNSLRDFIREHKEIEIWVSVNNPSYSDFKINGTTSIYSLQRDKECRYDYHEDEKVLYYVKEVTKLS